MKPSREERVELLELFRDLRVVDVRDGMDWSMMHYSGSMFPDIRPLYRTRFAGIARTARYVPYTGAIPEMTPGEYTEWSDLYYREVCCYPWMDEIEDGDFIVIDQGGVNVGLMGSNNSRRASARGHEDM